MKTKNIIAPFCLALILASCAKEKPATLGKPNTQGVNQSQNGKSRETVDLLSPDELRAFLPTIAGFTPDEDGGWSDDETMTGASRVYHVSSTTGQDITMSIADLANTAEGRDAFFKGNGLELDAAPGGYSGLSVNIGASPNMQNKFVIIPISTGRYAMDYAIASNGWTPNGLNDAVVAPSKILRDDYSYIAAWEDDNNPDVSGWEIYEGGSQTAMLILMAKDSQGERFGIILCQNATENTNGVKALAADIDYESLRNK